MMSGAAFAGGVEVRFPGPGVELVGRYYTPAQPVARLPAVILLHGCSGMWARGGKPNASYDHWANHLANRGFAALLVDSFGPRGEKEICTQKDRSITPGRERSEDSHAALRWLARRPDIDPQRIHVLGWSNGAQTVLHAIKPRARGREAAGPQFRSAVAMYPGCAGLLKADWTPTAPLLIQAGGADDWTPAKPCVALAGKARAHGAQVEIDVYDGAHHAFDRIGGRIRERLDVVNPNRASGRGAMVGPHPEAGAKAWARVTAFLQAAR